MCVAGLPVRSDLLHNERRTREGLDLAPAKRALYPTKGPARCIASRWSCVLRYQLCQRQCLTTKQASDVYRNVDRLPSARAIVCLVFVRVRPQAD